MRTLAYATLGLALSAAPVLAANLVVDPDGHATPSNCDAPAVTPYLTIQSAVDAAAAGDTITVCPGSPYDEQPVIAKPLVLKGKGDATVRPSPMADNTTSLTTGNPIAAGILVMDAAGVTIESLAVDGADNGGTDCTKNPVGIYYRNASGTVQDAAVRNMRLGAGLEGCQGGLGILVQGAGDGTTAIVTVQGTSVHDYQKNGITGSGAGTSLTALRNRVTGLGPTPFIAQNGIQLSAGAGGRIQKNVIANHVWTGCTAEACPFVSTNILLFGPAEGVVVQGNTLADSQVSLYAVDTHGATLQGNDVTETSPFDAISVVGDANLLQANKVSHADESGIFIDGTGNTARRNRVNESPIGVWSFSGTNTVITTGVQMNNFFNVAVGVHTGSEPPFAPSRRAGAVRSGRGQTPSPAR
jgi:hypothetical protein